MKSLHKSGFTQPFRITYSQIIYRIEIALHVLVLIGILQLIEWPYILLFVLLFLLLGWQFFNNHSIRSQYNEDCYIQILNNPASINWIQSKHECAYPEHEVKILMTRWFILLQLGKRKTKIGRILLADSFDNFESYSNCRKIIIENKLC